MLSGTPCREADCGQYLVWLKTEKGANMPVEVESLDATDDETTMYDPSRHEAHWGNCTKPDQFRKPKAAKLPWKYLRLHDTDQGVDILIAIQGDRVRARVGGGKTVEAQLTDKLDSAMPVILPGPDGS